MKRDLDLIRKILLEVESCTNVRGVDTSMIKVSGTSTDVIKYHVGLLVDAGLITGKRVQLLESSGAFYLQLNLTSRGHEFLDNARNDSIWQTVKKELGSKWGSVSFGVLETLLKQAVLKILGTL